MTVLTLLTTGFFGTLFFVVLLLKLVAKATGGYDSLEHVLLNVVLGLLAAGLAAAASTAFL